jgi:hypothetical protein
VPDRTMPPARCINSGRCWAAFPIRDRTAQPRLSGRRTFRQEAPGKLDPYASTPTIRRSP